MSRTPLLRRAAATCALAILPAGCQLATVAPPASPAVAPIGKHAQLAAALASADRVEVVSLSAAADAPPLHVSRGPDVATEFLAEIQVDDLWSDFRCECGHGQAIRFFRGDQPVVQLEIRRHQTMRWPGGPWTGDAQIVHPGDGRYARWFQRIGGDTSRLHPPGSFGGWAVRDEQDRQFAECFPPAARDIARSVGSVTREAFSPWRETTDLTTLVPDKLALATAAFRALGATYRPWNVDDYRIAAIQTAVAALAPEDFLRALQANAQDDRALRGAARIYFRLSVHRRLPPAANAEWLPRLADAMLRTGERHDLAFVLIYTSATQEPAAWTFLREIASGTRTYAWPTGCEPLGLASHEPSLVASAAVLLALSGDLRAPRLAASAKVPVLGLDSAAREIAEALVTPARPLRAAHFRHESRLLFYAATQAASRLPTDAIPASALGAVLANNDFSFGSELSSPFYRTAAKLGLQRHREPVEVNLFSSPVDQSLPASDPAEAIRLCTEKLPASRGVDRTALFLVRAIAHENSGHVDEAIADFQAALKSGGYSEEIIHKRLAFHFWRQGRIIDANRHIELALRAKPDADMFTLRGIIKYGLGNFGPDADLDFTAAIALQPNQGYSEIFQHLCAHLSQRPTLSRLSGEVRYETPPQNQITLGPGPSLSIDFSGGAMPPWPAAIISFLKGNVADDALLLQANSGGAAEQIAQTCEAHFYIAQKARLAGNVALERAHLTRCLAGESSGVAEYRLAVLRLDQLK